MQLDQTTFIVTGGGSGLGAATARRFVKGGGNVVIADLNKPAGEGVAKELGAKARFVECDVTDEAAVNRAIAAAQETFGGLHGAINCAGIGTAMRVAGKEGPHNLDVFAAAHHQDSVESNGFAGFACQALHRHDIVLGDAVLLAAGFNDCEH